LGAGKQIINQVNTKEEAHQPFALHIRMPIFLNPPLRRVQFDHGKVDPVKKLIPIDFENQSRSKFITVKIQ
jgi:hypothetical protein